MNASRLVIPTMFLSAMALTWATPALGCTKNSDCVTGESCWAGVCKDNTGTGCTSSGTECVSGVCTKGVCSCAVVNGNCLSDADCCAPGNICKVPTGQCKITTGNGWCLNNLDCASNNCDLNPLSHTQNHCLCDGVNQHSCLVSADCCAGESCSPAPAGHCRMNTGNAGCTGGADCLSNYCVDPDFWPPKLGPNNQCLSASKGGTCLANRDCESLNCNTTTHTCQGCSALGGGCNVNGDCCLGQGVCKWFSCQP